MLVENRRICTVCLKRGKANTLPVAFGGNGEKQNMSVPSKYLLYQVLKILTTLCEPLIAMTNESIVKTREAHNEKNKYDIMQELVQNSNPRELYFVVHSSLPKTFTMCLSHYQHCAIAFMQCDGGESVLNIF
jgi:hypothetical protein